MVVSPASELGSSYITKVLVYIIGQFDSEIVLGEEGKPLRAHSLISSELDAVCRVLEDFAQSSKDDICVQVCG